MFYRESVRPHTFGSEFDVATIQALPRVEIAMDYAGFDGAALAHLTEDRPDGIVLSTFAGGRMSAGARAGVEAAVAAGIPVVVASRVPGGRIVGNPAAAIGAAVARDLPPPKARILLMRALTRGSDLGTIQRALDRY